MVTHVPPKINTKENFTNWNPNQIFTPAPSITSCPLCLQTQCSLAKQTEFPAHHFQIAYQESSSEYIALKQVMAFRLQEPLIALLPSVHVTNLQIFYGHQSDTKLKQSLCATTALKVARYRQIANHHNFHIPMGNLPG